LVCQRAEADWTPDPLFTSIARKLFEEDLKITSIESSRFHHQVVIFYTTNYSFGVFLLNSFKVNKKMSSKYWTTEPNGYLEPVVLEHGAASLKPKTVIQVFQETVQKHGKEKALCIKRPVNVSIFFYY
jgi:hypothetical protein